MAYKDFLSARDKLALEFFKLKFKQLSDEQKLDVKQGLLDNYRLRNSFKESTPRTQEFKSKQFQARLRRMK